MAKSNKVITLKEHEKLYRRGASGAVEDNSLGEEEFAELREYLINYPTEDDKPPLVVKGDHLKATNYVGAILTQRDTQIEILPKIDLANKANSEEGREQSDASDDEAASDKASNESPAVGLSKVTSGDDALADGITPDIGEADGEGDGTSSEKESKADRDTRKIFIKMLLSYLGRHQRQFESGVWGEENLPLLEAFIAVFLQEVQVIIKRGLARTYIPYEDNLTCLKGKLDFTNHIRHNLFHKERFYVRFDEFSIDRPINRVIKRALREVCRVAQNPINYRLANQQLHYFDEVRNTRDWRHDVKVSRSDRTVSSKAYQDAFAWAQVLLQHLSPNNWNGERQTISLLFPMERVFESYVTQRLSEISAEYVAITPQSSTHKVMEEQRQNGASFTIMPDMVAHSKFGNYCFILDTKWKHLDSSKTSEKYGISQGDIYQLYSYGKVYQRQEDKDTSLVLLYPRSEKFQEPIEFIEGGVITDHTLSLRIVPVDIAGLTSNKNSKTCKDAERQLRDDIFPEELRAKFKEAS